MNSWRRKRGCRSDEEEEDERKSGLTNTHHKQNSRQTTVQVAKTRYARRKPSRSRKARSGSALGSKLQSMEAGHGGTGEFLARGPVPPSVCVYPVSAGDDGPWTSGLY